MIAKNIKGKSFKGCVSYVMHQGATLLEAEGVWAETTKDLIRSFTIQRSGRKEIKQPVGHIPIAFSPEDKERMTDEFMVLLAKEYMEEMGIKNTQYIIVRHENTANPHLHMVDNRINNDLKLISVNHDYKRNIKICKKLKDKYNLTYGQGKEKVKREKLNNPDKVKYYIHDAIMSVLSSCKHPADLRFALKEYGIDIDYKHKRATNEIEGVSFRYKGIAFKGSEVDRKFSFGKLKKMFEKNVEEMKKRGQKEQLWLQTEQKTKQVIVEKPSKEAVSKTQPTRHSLISNGIKLSDKQEELLMNGDYIFLENMTSKNGKSRFFAYVFLNDEKNQAFFSDKNPDEFVKYSNYEMRIRDKILVENGHITKAKVKWYGIGTFADPYLWKSNQSDTEHKESWDDPRLSTSPKQEQKPRQPIIRNNNRGRKR